MTEKNVSEKRTESAGQARALGLFLLKRYNEAAAVYDDLLKKNPKNVVFFLNRMICRLQYSAVNASFFDQMIKCVNDLPTQGYLCLADVLNNLNREEEALIFVNKALERDSENIDAYVLKAMLLNKSDRFDELSSLIQIISSRFKKEERILCLLAYHAALIGDSFQAERFLKKALKRNRFAVFQNELFYQALLMMDKKDEILKIGNEALKVRKDNPVVLSVMIKVYRDLEEYESAADSFRILSDTVGLSEKEQFDWAETLIELQEYDKAFDLLLQMKPRPETWLLYLQDLFKAMQRNGWGEKCCEFSELLKSRNEKNPELQFVYDAVLLNKDRTENVPLSLVRLMNDRNAGDLMLSTSDSSYSLSFLLEEMLNFLEVPVGQSLNVLDLGCGTGGMAPVLENYSRPSGFLMGVDISPAVLDFARDQKKYDDFQEADLVSFCKKKVQAKRYDLIVCMDVLSCFSQLTPVFKAVKKALKPEGKFIFSILPLIETERNFIFENGLFYHSSDYVFSCLKASKLQAEYQQEGFLYKDKESPCLVFAVKMKK